MSYQKTFKITLKREGLENDLNNLMQSLKDLYDQAKENYEFYSFLELNFPDQGWLRIIRPKNTTEEIIDDELMESYELLCSNFFNKKINEKNIKEKSKYEMYSSSKFELELKFFVFSTENQNEEKFSQSLIVGIQYANNEKEFKENLEKALKKLKKIFENELRANTQNNNSIILLSLSIQTYGMKDNKNFKLIDKMGNKKALELQALRSCIDKFKDFQLNNNNYNDNEIKLSILYTTDNKRHVYNNHIEENKINKEKNYEKVFKKIHDILENYKAKDKILPNTEISFRSIVELRIPIKSNNESNNELDIKKALNQIHDIFENYKKADKIIQFLGFIHIEPGSIYNKVISDKKEEDALFEKIKSGFNDKIKELPDNKKPPFVLFKIEFFVKPKEISNSPKSS